MKRYFELEKQFLITVEDQTKEINIKEILDDEKINELRNSFPKIPESYLSYLSEIGAGNIREHMFKIQPYLFTMEDLGLEDIYDVKEEILFFGDNYSGDFSGFDFSENNDKVVELWHETGEIYNTEKTFKEYIQNLMEFPL